MIAQLKNITKIYEIPGSSHKRQVLENVSLDIEKGDSISIIGPSGTGKSTLLNILGTLDKPTSGNVFINNNDITKLQPNELALLRNNNIGFIFQNHHLLPQLTLLENILVPVIPQKDKLIMKNAKERAMHLLEVVDLVDNINQLPAQLSGGECQRSAVVRALINNPELILADEPTGSLDQESAEKLGELLVKVNKEQHFAIVVVTHSQELAKKMDVTYKLVNNKLEKSI